MPVSCRPILLDAQEKSITIFRVVSSPERLWTASEYREMPEGPPWIQLVNGQLVCEPSPGLRHQGLLLALVEALSGHVRAAHLGRVYFAPLDVYLSDHDVFQPDLIFVSCAREDILAEDGIHGAPDLTVEIVSPSSARRDSVHKLQVYRTSGVSEYWLIDPVAQTFQITHFGAHRDGTARSLQRNEVLRSPLFPGLVIVIADLFGSGG